MRKTGPMAFVLLCLLFLDVWPNGGRVKPLVWAGLRSRADRG